MKDTLRQFHTNADGDATYATLTRDAAADFVMLLLGTADELSELAAGKQGLSRIELQSLSIMVHRDALMARESLLEFNQRQQSAPSRKRRWFSRT